MARRCALIFPFLRRVLINVPSSLAQCSVSVSFCLSLLSNEMMIYFLYFYKYYRGFNYLLLMFCFHPRPNANQHIPIALGKIDSTNETQTVCIRQNPKADVWPKHGSDGNSVTRHQFQKSSVNCSNSSSLGITV